jgi:lysophosphatidate acyltransferase
VQPPSLSRLSSWVRHAAGFFVIASTCVVLIYVLVPLLPFRGLRIRAGNLAARPMARVVLRLAGIRLKIEGRRPQGRAIYVMNHTGASDPFVAMILSPTGCCGIAKTEIAWTPFFGQAYWLSGHLLVNRSDSASAVSAFRALVPVVDRHRLSVWLWPEGTVAHDGQLLPFKRGFVHLAIATGLPVVPIVAHGAHNLWPTRTMTLRPGELRVEILEPIDTSEWTEEEVDQRAQEVHDLVARRLGQDQPGS